MSAPSVAASSPGLQLSPEWLGEADRAELLAYLGGLRPLWEQRYSARRPAPRGQEQRRLLRPVYWLGNWQFACLGYYEPPRNTRDCAVAAEPFPPVMARLVAEIEARVRRATPRAEIPGGWRLNTCLINLYGHRLEGERWVDAARVGEHRDREPGPVASLSLGERALFQLVKPGRQDGPPVRSLWLDDGSLLTFSGPFWKDSLLHRVLRVEDRQRLDLAPRVEGFRTRRINLTFRYVPEADVVPFSALSPAAREDVRGYVATLAGSSAHWRAALQAAPG